MNILKPNFKFAEPLANLEEITMLETIGINGILEKDNAEHILQMLVNSGYLSEGTYKNDK